jgi:hypothetical protein
MLMTTPLLSLGDIGAKKSNCTVARVKKMRSVAGIPQIRLTLVRSHRGLLVSGDVNGLMP